jgi:hypothetical protein
LVIGPFHNREWNHAEGHPLASVWRDDEANVWLCVEVAQPGEVGRWQKIGGPSAAGQLHVLPAPARIYDSRVGEQPLDVAKGKLSNSAERVIDAFHDIDVESATGRAPTAALVNLTVTGTTSTGGYLALFPNGQAWPGTSSINWDAVGRAVANTTVVGLDASGRFRVRAAPGGGTDFVIDTLGYWL